MQQRHADLSIVDQIVRVLLPDAEAEIAGSDGNVAAELELRIALRLEVERRQPRLQRQVEQMRGRRADVFK
jgi:hypothetical protein